VWKCLPYALLWSASWFGSHMGGRYDVDCLCVWFWTPSVSRFFRKWRQWLTGNVHWALWVRMLFKIGGFVCGCFYAVDLDLHVITKVPMFSAIIGRQKCGTRVCVRCWNWGCLREWPVKIERVSASAPSRMTTETDQFTTHVGTLRWLSGGQYLEIQIIRLRKDVL
jgi:hypothetical protein